MLRSFQLANHRSIRDEHELLLFPVRGREPLVLPVTAIYGPNAAGKSNLIDGLHWFQQAVLHSFRTWEPDAEIPRDPFRLDPQAAAEPSSYVVVLVLDGTRYLYGVSLDDAVVREEWLYAYPRRHKRVIFERQGQTVEFGSTIKDRRRRAELLGGALGRNSFFLSMAAQTRQEEVLPVYRWFRDGLRILDGARPSADSPGEVADHVIDAVHRHPEFIELLKRADLGIVDLEIVPTNAEAAYARSAAEIVDDNVEGRHQIARRTIEDRRKRGDLQDELTFLHGEKRVPFSPADESDGTLAVADLLAAILSALNDGATLVVDEIDASLHPLLTTRLLELFRDGSANPHGAQLIFTTHDTALLGTNLDLNDVLRRDEIWFVDKNKDGATSIYPLTSFRPGKGEERDHDYLDGIYRAVPRIFPDSLVRQLITARDESDHDNAA
ncbi:AAA family ATPase [Actinoplanes sp. TBRC 11911]|uniref:AAA family ATPase n=1 Tax=Actinoplanes sp. TBRC 11911 TaxID=2729386 RepID=UPI00145C9E4F|nr:ATP-binding protein [Actinoplanes sp. TBRC 11911]NMO52764.1 AAA family ATPase [Actinoplanes sp. TBRC 11911]